MLTALLVIVLVNVVTAPLSLSLSLSLSLPQIWPHADYPLIPVGKMVLNRNPKNYFAEVEQFVFEPSNMPPGIEPSPDKMLQVYTR